MRSLLRQKSDKRDKNEMEITLKSSNSQRNNKLIDSFCCKVRLLDDAQSPLDFCLAKTDTGENLFDSVCQKLGQLLERDYFGLRYADKHKQRQWLDLKKTVYKQLRDSKSHSLSFRVKHYPPDPIKDFKQEFSRYLLYQQIRRDLAQGRLLCPPSMVGKMGALVMQAELGDAPLQNTLIMGNESVADAQIFDQIDGDTSSTNVSSENFDKSTDQNVNAQSSSYENLSKLKIIFNQTADIEEEIMKEYLTLRGLTATEAENELLAQVSQSPTYGIDPFLASVSDKSSSYLSISPQTSKESSFYLGLSHAGVVIFIGRQRSHEYTWDRIHHMNCDGKRFQIHLQKDSSKTTSLSFHCQSEAAALAFWRWAVDRMHFFTLKDTNKIKKIKSSSTVLHRSHTYRFSGRSHYEIAAKTKALSNLPQPEFTRVSSFRQATRMMNNTQPNGVINYSTLPGRLNSSSDANAKPTDDNSKITNLQELKQLCMDAVVENSPKANNISDVVVECLSNSDANVSVCNAQPINDNGETQNSETESDSTNEASGGQLSEAVITSNLTTASTEIDAKSLTKHIDSFNDAIKVDQTDHKHLDDEHKIEYVHVFSELDKTIDQHTNLNFKNMNGYLNTTSKIAATKFDSTNMNGDLTRTHASFDNCANGRYDQCMKTTTRKVGSLNQNSNVPSSTEHNLTHTRISLTVAALATIIGVITILETTPDPSSADKSNILYRLVRGNYLIVAVDNLLYNPIKNAVSSIFESAWSFLRAG